jgi:RNA polymerase sigma-70 factor (ECF subfamily)
MLFGSAGMAVVFAGCVAAIAWFGGVLSASAADDNTVGAAPPSPRVIKTFPAAGATEVSVKTTEIVAVFDQDMLPGYSWIAGPHFPQVAGDPVWRDKRTCVLPVKLERGKFYRVGLNSSDEKLQNFTNEEGSPALPHVIYFVTEGATDAEKQKVIAPRIVGALPADGAQDVDPSLDRILVTFDKPMSRGMSWTGYGTSYPQASAPAYWKDDKRTCVFPVKLQPDTRYSIGINDDWYLNFQSADGVPVEPVVIRFKTREKKPGQ